jgi:hypothetical protein
LYVATRPGLGSSFSISSTTIATSSDPDVARPAAENFRAYLARTISSVGDETTSATEKPFDGHHLTKTPGSVRAVELRPRPVQALKEQQAASRLKSEFVFCDGTGGPLDRDNVMNHRIPRDAM